MISDNIARILPVATNRDYLVCMWLCYREIHYELDDGREGMERTVGGVLVWDRNDVPYKNINGWATRLSLAPKSIKCVIWIEMSSTN